MADTDGGVVLASSVFGNIPCAFWPEPPNNDNTGMLYAGEMNVTAGPSGVGKSMFTLKRAADLTRQGSNVLYVNHEDSTLMQRFRFEVASADLDRVFFAEYKIPRHIHALRDVIEEYNIVLVVFDTALKTIEGPIQRWDLPLKRLVKEVLQPTGCAADFVHHTNKNVKKNSSWHAAIGGSTGGLAGTARTVQLMGRRPEDVTQTLCGPVKDNYKPPPKAIAYEFATKLVKQEDGEEVDVSYLEEAERDLEYDEAALTQIVVLHGSNGEKSKKGPPPEQAAAANEFLVEVLKFGPLPVTTQWRCIDNPDSSEDGEDPKHADKSSDNKDWRSRECGALPAGRVDEKNPNGPRCPDCGGKVEELQGIEEYFERMSPDCSWTTVKRCKAPTVLDLSVSKRGAGKASFWIWGLPSDHPDLASTAKDYLP